MESDGSGKKERKHIRKIEKMEVDQLHVFVRKVEYVGERGWQGYY